MLGDDDLQLRCGLHPFDDHPQPKRMGHRDDGRDDLGVFRVGVDFEDEAAIDLEGVDGKAAQIAEGGIASRRLSPRNGADWRGDID